MRIVDNPKDPRGRLIFPILCPTRDHGALAVTMYTLVSAIYEMGMFPVYFEQRRAGFAYSRTCCFKRAKAVLNVDRVRGLFLDDDMLLIDAEGFIHAIMEAENLGCSFVAPAMQSYNGVETIDVCVDGKPGETPLSEAEKLTPWQPVTNAGLGFYYGDLPLDYTFREGDPNVYPGIGEDRNFFADNPDIDVRLAPLKVGHVKPIPLQLPDDLPLFRQPA